MRVLILGGGNVGNWIADILCRRRHSVTVVDRDADTVRRINSELDVRAVQGNAAQSTVLFQCDICSADIVLAVTGIDEVNLVAASMSKKLGARRTIARVYAPAYHDLSTFDYQAHFGIDSLLSLEQLSAAELARAIRNPDSIPLEHFARGQLEVYELEVADSAEAAGSKLRDIRLSANVRIGSIARQDRIWIPSGADELHAGDRISLIGKPADVNGVRKRFGGRKTRFYRPIVMIAGGGETGYHLAQILSADRYRVVILEQDEERCASLSKTFPNATVVHASANRRAVLEEEGTGTVDYFVACTGNDENNIMSGVEARELGADRVMCVVERPDYANVVGKLGIDLAVSERDVMARQILGFMHEGAVISRRRLPDSTIAVYEIEVRENSGVAGKSLSELPFAGRCLIAAIARDSFIQVPNASDRLEPGDTVVALIDDEHAESALKEF